MRSAGCDSMSRKQTKENLMIQRTSTVSAVCTAMTMAGAAVAGNGTLPCPADVDCDGAVNVFDLLTVLGDWGASDSPGDLNGDNNVDVFDLLIVLGDWGPCLHDFGPEYENAEAVQIGLEMISHVGPLPQAVYDRIDGDLELIRTEHPELADQFHAMAWAPNQLIAAKPQSAPVSDEYECLNTYYQVVDDKIFASFGDVDYHLLTFAGKLNPVALVPIYAALPDVNFAEPNGLIGGQNFWEPIDLGGGVWRWEIDDGWHDCFDGCDCHRFYTIEVDAAGQVTIISIEEFGAPWCEFKF